MIKISVLLLFSGSLVFGPASICGLEAHQDLMKKLHEQYLIESSQFRTPPGARQLETIRVYTPEGDDPKSVFIGAVQDFAEDGRGRVFIPDRQGDEILVFDQKGEFQFRFGRTGQGPGEFNRPTGIFAWGDKILTHEVMALRFQIFDAKGRFLSSFISSKPYGDFVVKGEKIYASSSLSGPPEFANSLIDVLDFEGKVLSSFGAVPQVPRYNSEGLASAKIASADGRILFVAFRYLPIIRTYSFDGRLLGELKWQTGISEKYVPLNEKMFTRRNHGEQTPLGLIINAIWANEDGLYVATAATSRLEIVLIDRTGKVLEYYYKNLSSALGCSGLIVRKTDGGKEFHVLRLYPEHAVEVFATKK